MTQKRKYDIGGNVIIEDDGYTLTALHRISDTSSRSIGMARPRIDNGPRVYPVIYSRDEKLFYVTAYADPFKGFFFFFERLTRPPATNSYATFLKDTPFTYYRVALHFHTYDVKESRDRYGATLEATNDAVLDYINLAKPIFDEQERQFNEVIAHTGRDVRWIMSKIGAWVPFPQEPPPIVLGD